MTLIRSAISTSSPEFRENVRAMRALVADLREKVAWQPKAEAPRPATSTSPAASCCHGTDRASAGSGFTLSRDRPARRHGLYGGEAPCGGIIAGIAASKAVRP